MNMNHNKLLSDFNICVLVYIEYVSVPQITFAVLYSCEMIDIFNIRYNEKKAISLLICPCVYAALDVTIPSRGFKYQVGV